MPFLIFTAAPTERLQVETSLGEQQSARRRVTVRTALGRLPACLRPATLAWLQRGSSSVVLGPSETSVSASGVATLQCHLENWPGLGMTISPANKAVYINPAKHRAKQKAPVVTLRQLAATACRLGRQRPQRPPFHLSASSGHCSHSYPSSPACR